MSDHNLLLQTKGTQCALLRSRDKKYFNDLAVFEIEDHSIIDGPGNEPLAFFRAFRVTVSTVGFNDLAFRAADVNPAARRKIAGTCDK